MNTVFVLPPREHWIVDRMTKEWNDDNLDISRMYPSEADVIWLLADWCWKHLPYDMLQRKKVLTTVHHIVPEKFGEAEKRDFLERDVVTTAYHVFNKRTEEFIRPLTDKPIHVIHYWANQNIWHRTDEKYSLRAKHNLPTDQMLIGSFQRDTEGRDKISPKLEKGPDLFVEYVINKHKAAMMFSTSCLTAYITRPHVILAGWRRQYVMKRLTDVNIPFTYFELPSQEVLNELYQTLDIYPVTSRHEGGPQSLIECGLLGVSVVSRPVGIAEQVLPSTAINIDVFRATPAVPNVEAWKLPYGYEQYRKLIEEI